MHFIAHHHGQGKTHFARQAASPSVEDVVMLSKFYAGSEKTKKTFQKQISKLLCICNLEVSLNEMLPGSASGTTGHAELAR